MPTKLISVHKSHCLFRHGVKRLWDSETGSGKDWRVYAVVKASNHWFKRFKHLYQEEQYTHDLMFSDETLINSLREKWNAVLVECCWIGMEDKIHMLINLPSSPEEFLFRCQYPSIDLYKLPHNEN